MGWKKTKQVSIRKRRRVEPGMTAVCWRVRETVVSEAERETVWMSKDRERR